MDPNKLSTSALFLFLGFLTLMPKLKGNTTSPTNVPRPLCASQFALAGYACALIPFRPSPPPTPPPTNDKDGQRQEHNHHRAHGHRDEPDPRPTAEEENCCRWLKQLDSECVCDVLLHLPNFLDRPIHKYSVIVGDACTVSYTCGGHPLRFNL